MLRVQIFFLSLAWRSSASLQQTARWEARGAPSTRSAAATALAPRFLRARSFSMASELEDGVVDIASLKKRYFELAKRYHPDVNGEEFQQKFVDLGRAYEIMLGRLTAEAAGVDFDEESVEYDEDAARETFQRTFESIADTLSQGLSRQQRRELKEVADTMVSGGARGGGWFEFANA